VSDDGTLEHDFEALVSQHSRRAFRVALAVLRDPGEAEDVAQECFLRAHRAFASLRERGRFQGWLVRMAFRLSLDRQRASRRRRRHENAAGLEAARASSSVDDDAARSERREKLMAAVDALPTKLRLVTLLVAIEGHDVRAVARLLDVPEGTVKSRLHLARKTLAERLCDVV